MFSTNLQAALRRKGWNEYDLVAELKRRGISVCGPTAHRWINGRNVPRLPVLCVVAEVLGASIDDLLATTQSDTHCNIQ